MYEKIILISLDTLRNDCLGVAPLKRYESLYENTIKPNTSLLDKIASEGVYFSNCISAAPYTSASHGAIFSGQWPLNNGLYEIYNQPISAKLIFEYFKDFGYKTIMNVEFPFIIGDYLNLKKGVDQYFIDDTDSALEQMTEKSVSFFHFAGIHYPYGFHKYKFGKEDYVKKVEKLEHELGIKEKRFSDKLVEAYYDERDLDLLMRYKNIIRFLIDNKKYEQLFNLYLEGIDYFLNHRFDKFWNSLMSKIKDQNYLIVIFSDHGEEWSDDSEGHYNSLSAGVLNVPLIFLSNDLDSKKINEKIRTIDILPTILKLNGMPSGSNISGISLDELMKTGNLSVDLECFAQCWIAKEYDKLKKVRMRMMKQNIKHLSIEHFLYKEVVYSEGNRLLREYSANGILEKEYMEKDDNFKNKLNHTEDKKKMRDLLKEYNKGRLVCDFKKNNNQGIRAMLKNLGYNV